MHLIFLKEKAATAPTAQEGSQKEQGPGGGGELRIACGEENPMRHNDKFSHYAAP
jgi:hypothetical protein